MLEEEAWLLEDELLEDELLLEEVLLLDELELSELELLSLDEVSNNELPLEEETLPFAHPPMNNDEIRSKDNFSLRDIEFLLFIRTPVPQQVANYIPVSFE
jgi:hypothetical protein